MFYYSLFKIKEKGVSYLYHELITLTISFIMVGDTGLEPVRSFEQRILVEDRGAAPLIKTAFSVSPLCLPHSINRRNLTLCYDYNINQKESQDFMAEVLRIELRYMVLETIVLPLNYTPISWHCRQELTLIHLTK